MARNTGRKHNYSSGLEIRVISRKRPFKFWP